MIAQLKKIRDGFCDGLITLVIVPSGYFVILIISFFVLGPLSLPAEYLGLMNLSYLLRDLLVFMALHTDLKDVYYSNMLYFAWGCFVSGFCLSLMRDKFPFYKNHGSD